MFSGEGSVELTRLGEGEANVSGEYASFGVLDSGVVMLEMSPGECG